MPATLNTEMLAADDAGIFRAVEILRVGGLVAFPTETVYGLGGDARDGQAVARIFEAKGRPAFNPLIAHVATTEAAAEIAELPEAARRLAAAFWPGPLTLVAPRRTDCGVSELATAGLDTIALRAPDHPLAHRLLAEFGGPVAAPSANRSGAVSATTAAHVLEGLSGRIDAILDGGPCPVGLESTIIGFEGDDAILLRPGGLPAEAIETALDAPLRHFNGASTTPSAPGQLSSHYAPGAALRLNALAPRPGEAWLGFGPDPEAAVGLSLSPSGDLREAAANLFAHLRTLDARLGHAGVIAVAPIPDRGLGLAINDRLSRAAAPRETP